MTDMGFDLPLRVIGLWPGSPPARSGGSAVDMAGAGAPPGSPTVGDDLVAGRNV